MVTKFKIRLLGDFNLGFKQFGIAWVFYRSTLLFAHEILHLLVNQARNLFVKNFKKILMALYTFSFFQSLEMLS